MPYRGIFPDQYAKPSGENEGVKPAILILKERILEILSEKNFTYPGVVEVIRKSFSPPEGEELNEEKIRKYIGLATIPTTIEIARVLGVRITDLEFVEGVVIDFAKHLNATKNYKTGKFVKNLSPDLYARKEERGLTDDDFE